MNHKHVACTNTNGENSTTKEAGSNNVTHWTVPGEPQSRRTQWTQSSRPREATLDVVSACRCRANRPRVTSEKNIVVSLRHFSWTKDTNTWSIGGLMLGAINQVHYSASQPLCVPLPRFVPPLHPFLCWRHRLFLQKRVIVNLTLLSSSLLFRMPPETLSPPPPPSPPPPFSAEWKRQRFSKGCLIRQSAAVAGPRGCCQACLCSAASAGEIYPVCFGTAATCFSLCRYAPPLPRKKNTTAFSQREKKTGAESSTCAASRQIQHINTLGVPLSARLWRRLHTFIYVNTDSHRNSRCMITQHAPRTLQHLWSLRRDHR